MLDHGLGVGDASHARAGIGAAELITTPRIFP